MTSAEAIVECINSIRLKSVPQEADIHLLIAGALSDSGIEFIHEAPVAPRKRADFFASGTVIEVKKGKPSLKSLIKQLEGYLSAEGVSCAIAVTQRRVNLPEYICGKKVYNVPLDRLWGVSLP